MQPANGRARDYQSTVGVVESRFHVLHFVWGNGGGYGAILREMRRAPRKRFERDVPWQLQSRLTLGEMEMKSGHTSRNGHPQRRPAADLAVVSLWKGFR